MAGDQLDVLGMTRPTVVVMLHAYMRDHAA